MNAKELWNSFINEYPKFKDETYEAWSFGVDEDQLAELTLKGIKTATTSGYEFYELENEPLPKEEEFNIILDSNEQAVCITQTTRVYVVPFNEVTEKHAYKEGEGDRSLDYWRRVHIDFFSKECREANLSFNDDRLVVCEEFKIVYKK